MLKSVKYLKNNVKNMKWLSHKCTCIVDFFHIFWNSLSVHFFNSLKKLLKGWNDIVSYFIRWNSLSPEILILRKYGLKVKFIILSFLSQTIPGNVNNNETATYFFKTQFQAQYIKLKPVTFSGGISLRLDVLVCQHGRKFPTHFIFTLCTLQANFQFIKASIKVDRY